MRTEPTLPVELELLVLEPHEPGRSGDGRFGELDVVRPLARGGTSGVYLAINGQTGEHVVLKVLDGRLAHYPELGAQLHAEHALSTRTSHPGLVQIRDARRTKDDVPFLVMEFLDGVTLAALTEHVDLELGAIVAIGAQIAAAVAALHAAGVIHCDLKHDNVVVLDGHHGRAPRVKVIDFGVSRTVDAPPLPDAGIAGTPWCMAPEQWRGAPTTASDVYALGCVLYELTTGVAPFDGSLPELMMAHLEQRPARPSWVRAMPIELERLILRALAKDPAVRPTMDEMAHALAELHDVMSPSELRRAS